MALLELLGHRVKFAPQGTITGDIPRMDTLHCLRDLSREFEDRSRELLLSVAVFRLLSDQAGARLREKYGIEIHRLEKTLSMALTTLKPLVEREEG